MTESVPVVAPSASGRAIAALVFGILAFVVCLVFAPVAWVLGAQELGDIRVGRASAAGEGMARAGQVMGIVGTAIMGVAVLVIGFWIMVAVAVIALVASCAG